MDIEEEHQLFWTTSKKMYGEYLRHEFWTAVGEKEYIYTCVKVIFENGFKFINYVIKKGEISRMSIKERPIALVLNPKSKGKFFEVNNEARYKFTATKKNEHINLEVSIHNKKLSAIKLK